MKTARNDRSLWEIVDRSDDLKKIISIYLDIGSQFDVDSRHKGIVIFSVVGIGLDGEPQEVWMDYNGQLHRRYRLPNFTRRLSVAGCKVLFILHQMGYALHEYQLLKVRKYAAIVKAKNRVNYAV